MRPRIGLRVVAMEDEVRSSLDVKLGFERGVAEKMSRRFNHTSIHVHSLSRLFQSSPLASTYHQLTLTSVYRKPKNFEEFLVPYKLNAFNGRRQPISRLHLSRTISRRSDGAVATRYTIAGLSLWSGFENLFTSSQASVLPLLRPLADSIIRFPLSFLTNFRRSRNAVSIQGSRS